MTSEIVYLMHCDHLGCDRVTPEKQADGWTNAIYTHGCPDHGALIATHQAKITDTTRGRGSKEKTTWYLVCACGWSPTPNFEVHTAARLKRVHLAHVHQETAGLAARIGSRKEYS